MWSGFLYCFHIVDTKVNDSYHHHFQQQQQYPYHHIDRVKIFMLSDFEGEVCLSIYVLCVCVYVYMCVCACVHVHMCVCAYIER